MSDEQRPYPDMKWDDSRQCAIVSSRQFFQVLAERDQARALLKVNVETRMKLEAERDEARAEASEALDERHIALTLRDRSAAERDALAEALREIINESEGRNDGAIIGIAERALAKVKP